MEEIKAQFKEIEFMKWLVRGLFFSIPSLAIIATVLVTVGGYLFADKTETDEGFYEVNSNISDLTKQVELQTQANVSKDAQIRRDISRQEQKFLDMKAERLRELEEEARQNRTIASLVTDLAVVAEWVKDQKRKEGRD